MSARAIARFANWLRGADPNDHHRHSAAIRQRLEEVRAHVAKWKARVTDGVARERALLARAQAAEQALDGVKHRVAVARRETPSIEVLRQSFSHRLRTLPARVSARTSAGEAQLLEISASYRAALESVADSPDPTARRLQLDGLTWWVPAKALKDRAVPGAAGGQRFPYRGILQTRGVAIGGIMLDLGANVGRMAVSRVILGDATVAYCAEPDPVTFACLARNVIDNRLRGLVLPDQTAIGDRDGSVRLLRAGGPGSYRVVSDVADGMSNTVDVPCATLDTWVERLRIDLDAVTFIKVDVEGFERRVVTGARRVLHCSHIAWQMEIKPAGLRSVGDDPQELYADLRQAFTHFIDLNRQAPGRRVRPIAELSDALQYIEPRRKTDVLLFSGT
jgi:FkbM family methyltransferase